MDRRKLIKLCEHAYDEMRSFRIDDPSSPWHGLLDPSHPHPISFLETLLVLYSCEGSIHHKSQTLKEYMEQCISALLSLQTPSGFVSLADCNIDSAPDTAFYMHSLAICFEYITKKELDIPHVKNSIEKFLRKSMIGMCGGGIHTPNHRWVISCSLALCYRIFGDEELKTAAFRYINEGFDINSFGQWTERSNAIYNSVCDLYLYHIGSIFNVSTAFDAIRNNLNMMKFLLHPDNSIATEYSTRQDKAQKYYLDERYAIIYQLMAQQDGNGEYSYLSQLALDGAVNTSSFIMYDYLYDFKQIPTLPISDSYTILLNENEKQNGGFGDCVLRHRQGKLSLTIMEEQKDLLYVQYGNARMFGLRFVFGWFGVAAVPFSRLSKLCNNHYRLETELSAAYYGPLKDEYTREKNGNYESFDNSKRPHTMDLSVNVKIDFIIGENELDIKIKLADMPNLVAQVVCMFDEQGVLTGNVTKIDSNNFFLPDGSAVYINEGDSITVFGGSKQHNYTKLRNYDPNHMAKNLLINYLSPIDNTIKLVFSEVQL